MALRPVPLPVVLPERHVSDSVATRLGSGRCDGVAPPPSLPRTAVARALDRIAWRRRHVLLVRLAPRLAYVAVFCDAGPSARVGVVGLHGLGPSALARSTRARRHGCHGLGTCSTCGMLCLTARARGGRSAPRWTSPSCRPPCSTFSTCVAHRRAAHGGSQTAITEPDPGRRGRTASLVCRSTPAGRRSAPALISLAWCGDAIQRGASFLPPQSSDSHAERAAADSARRSAQAYRRPW